MNFRKRGYPVTYLEDYSANEIQRLLDATYAPLVKETTITRNQVVGVVLFVVIAVIVCVVFL